MKTFPLVLILMIVFSACSPTAKLLKEHHYSLQMENAAARLNANPNDKKAREMVQRAYSEALVYFQSELNRIRTGNDSLKWFESLDIMQQTNDLSGKIRENPIASKVVSELKFYTAEFQEVKQKAVDELFAAGQACMKPKTREKAREAYLLFKKVAMLAPGYNEITIHVNAAQAAATFNVVINPVQVEFNTLAVATKKIDKEFFYWTQRDVASRPFIRFYTSVDAEKQHIDPDFLVLIDVQDYRVEKLAAQTGSGTSNLMAIGNLYLKIYSSENQKVVFKKGISCRYDSQTKSTIRVNTIDLQRVIDPDIQTFFDYMLLSNFDRITEEIDTYFSTLVAQ